MAREAGRMRCIAPIEPAELGQSPDIPLAISGKICDNRKDVFGRAWVSPIYPAVIRNLSTGKKQERPGFPGVIPVFPASTNATTNIEDNYCDYGTGAPVRRKGMCVCIFGFRPMKSISGWAW